ncbi:MAG: nucleotidyltransferase family protein [Verrucomicrobiota bacterium]
MSVPVDQIIAVILAGGHGTRIRHLLPDLPKPMAPVMGQPFLHWVMSYLRNQGIRRVVISTGYRSEVIEDFARSKQMSNVNVQTIRESAPMGTAGGFRYAAETCGEKAVAWLVLNGDSLALAPLFPMLELLSDPRISGVLLGVKMTDTSRYGTVVQDSVGDLLRFDEKKPGAGIINAGVYLLRSSVLADFPPRAPLSFEREVFPALLARQLRLKVSVTQAPFLDIGTPESLQEAESFIHEHRHHFSDFGCGCAAPSYLSTRRSAK